MLLHSYVIVPWCRIVCKPHQTISLSPRSRQLTTDDLSGEAVGQGLEPVFQAVRGITRFAINSGVSTQAADHHSAAIMRTPQFGRIR